MRIGYTDCTYAEKRNIIGICPDVQYVDLRDRMDMSMDILKVVYHNTNFQCLNDRVEWFRTVDNSVNADMIHTFNSVCFTKKKWISTFESIIPRIVGQYTNSLEKEYKKYLFHRGVDALNKENCIQLLALSQDAYKRQENYLAEHGVDSKKILAKTQVLYPLQKMLIGYEDLEEKFADVEKEVRFIFIGNAFWCKGGAALCKVLSQYRGKYPIKLTIISQLSANHEHGVEVSKTEILKLKRWLKENESWVKIYKNLPNKKVLQIAKQSHIGLLPSYHETFGYSVLEMQAAGCPVITTDIRAFPEINDDNCGWLCKIAENVSQVDFSDTMNEEILGNELRNVMERLLNDIAGLKEKGRLSLQRIERKHSMAKYASELRKIYKGEKGRWMIF